jgi:hypothetical protein
MGGRDDPRARHPRLLLQQVVRPGADALIPAVVGRGPQLAAANSLGALVTGLVRLVGGPLGGALYALFGFATVVCLDAVGNAASSVLVTLLRYRPDPIRSAKRRRLPPGGRSTGCSARTSPDSAACATAPGCAPRSARRPCSASATRDGEVAPMLRSGHGGARPARAPPGRHRGGKGRGPGSV